MQTTSDEVLIARIAGGDRLAMQVLFARHHVRVYRFVLRLVRNEATAEDLISEVFLDIWRQAGKFEGRSAVSTWMLSIARFKALSALRKRPDEELDDETAEQIEDHSDDPEVALAKKDKAAVLREALSKLSAEHREIVDLVYYHEKSVEEVAGIVGIPEATVKTRMFYARKKLSEILKAARNRSRLAMNTTNKEMHSDIEELLPWHAAGTLSRRDTQRVEEALARDPELARRYALVREELGETILLNETLGAPSAHAMEKLFAKIDAEPARKPAMSLNLGCARFRIFREPVAAHAGLVGKRRRDRHPVAGRADRRHRDQGRRAPAAMRPRPRRARIRASAPSRSSVSRRRPRPTTSPSFSKPTSCRSRPDRWPAGSTRSACR